MSKMIFKVIPYWYGEDNLLYDYESVSFNPGLTVLVGCNGSGKSTLLKQIDVQCTEKGIVTVKFDNLHDGGSSARSHAGYFGDFDFLAASIQSSEGENINMNLGNAAKKLGAAVRQNPDTAKIVVLLDAIDSGLSIDGVVEFKQFLVNFICNDLKKRGVDLYIISAANSYELARNEACVNVDTGKHVKIASYDEYRNLIIESRKHKEARYKSDDTLEWLV